MVDKVSHIGVGFIIAVIVARYLGPEDFGLLSYAVSIASLFSAAGHVGLSGLVIREIVKNPDERGSVLGTTLGLKFIGMLTGYGLLLIYAITYEGIGSVEFIILAVVGGALLLKPLDIIDFWFQAFVQARYITLARLPSLVFSSGLKLIFVLLGFNVIYFAIANFAQALVTALAFIFIYKARSKLSISKWKFSWNKAGELFKQGWVIYLGSIFAMIYLKIDQVMLRWLEGPEAVGVYAVAAQLSEAWYFVPVAIVTSIFPELIKLKEKSESLFYKRLQQLFDLLFILAVGVAIIMTLISEWVITLFYGIHYLESASILVIHIWAAIFIFIRAAFSKWILIESVLMFSLITQGTGAVVNIALNYLLIPQFGVQGAAYATLLSYSFASVFSLLLYKKTRPICYMIFKSFLLISIFGRFYKGSI